MYPVSKEIHLFFQKYLLITEKCKTLMGTEQSEQNKY